MKMIYIFPSRLLDSKSSGIEKKVLMQKDAFTSLGIDCEVEHIIYRHNGKLEKVLRSIPFYSTFSKEVVKNVLDKVTEDVCAVYIRHVLLDRSFFSLIKNIRKKNPNIKILLELQTYPYDREIPPVIGIPALLKDVFYRNKLKRYIDRVVVLGNYDTVFGIPAIKISNGIDCSRFSVRSPVARNDNVIRLLAVASVARWHGYDRVIEGLGLYYATAPKRIIEFHIVGDGNVIRELKTLCKKRNIESYVFFHGWMSGKELDEMFDYCDIGVGSLGMHRIDLQSGNTLKLREYSVRGIPFIYGYNDYLIEKYFCDYSLKATIDNSSIDIYELISFYEKMSMKGFNSIAQEMHQAAQQYLSWKNQLEPVVRYIFTDKTLCN